MDKTKLLNIFIISLLLSLLVQSFFVKPPGDSAPITGVSLEVTDDAIMVPNIPAITIKNSLSGTLTVNPCTDISITINSEPLVGLAKDVPRFCTPILVPTGSSALLPMHELYQVFAKKSGKYLISVKTPA